MPRITEFDLRHDDFHFDGKFAWVEPLLIEVSVDIHGCFSIESVRLLLADDHAVSVPPVISDYVGCWALTNDGKAILRKAYEGAHPADPLRDEDHPDDPAPLWRSMRSAA